VIQKPGQHLGVEVPQKGPKKCLDYREPPYVCRGNPRTWFQKFYQNRGGILVLASVFRHGVLFSQDDPAGRCLDLLDSSSAEPPSLSNFLMQLQKDLVQKQKGRYNDFMNSILPDTIEEPGLDPASGRAVNMQTIKGQVAVITGAAGGIGQALALDMTRRGAAGIALVDFSERVVQLAREINTVAGRQVAIAYRGDTRDTAFRQGVYADITTKAGVPRICVPAAAITKDALAVKIDKQTGQVVIYPIEDFRKVVEINMIAPIYWAIELVAAVAKDRAGRGLKRWQPEEGLQGAVVFLGSIASVGNVGQISYSSTKAGLEGAASTLMAESMYYGVRCSVIHPGFTDTPMVRALGEDYIQTKVLPQTQLKRLIKPEEIADAICFMLTNAAVSGELWADAGWRPAT
jgi:NAD(P)-dependent dehydrogenase (short-subunit alcohol dehydrogenase family)